MTPSSLEIEHKFVVSGDFDVKSFFERVRSLKCDNEFATEVLDTYYFNRDNRRFILRHRKDDRIEQLSYKSIALDAEIRTEINLNLEMGKNPVHTIREFCQTMGMSESAQLHKSVTVFEFSDIEIVHYVARMGSDQISCVEFESVRHQTPEQAKLNIRKYESKLGFDHHARESRSIFDLLVLPFVAKAGNTSSEKSSAIPR